MATLFNRVKSAGLDRLGFHVTVESVTEPTPGFMLITLVGAELKSKGWRPGDRVSVRTPDDNLRNYTPFDWDADAGRARLLVAGRANGPGTRFVGSLGIGDDVQLLGPKKSVNLDFALAPIIVGDETVLGLCAAWKFANPDRPATVLLEAADIGACHVAAHSVDVTIERATRDGAALADATVEVLRNKTASPLILAGRAQSIATVRRTLKNVGLSVRPDCRDKTVVKAYWDENRTGLE